VADFIGRANFFPGTVVQVEGADLVVEALGVRRRASAAPGTYQPGQTVDVMLRPEEITVELPGRKGSLPATVARVSFLGSQAVYQLHCAGQPLLAITPLERGAPLAADGALVGLTFRDSALRAFAPDR
jgi:ABC-type Fe3+/spermidine/putrescine transport system ATPase subunit